MNGIVGKKLGMTQIYEEDGTVLPVTVVEAGPCVVVQRKTAETDGYDAVQLGLLERNRMARANRAMAGHFAKAGVEPVKRLMEFRLDKGEEAQAGDEVKVTIFAPADYVDVIGTSKGKGFQGVVKRHGHAGGRATHGSMFHRAPGSIGQSAFPSRVFPGLKLPGHMGAQRVTVTNLQVVKVDEEKNLIYLKGAVPGARNSYVGLRRSHRG